MVIFSRKTHGFVGETHHFWKHPYIDIRFHVKHLSCFSISSSLAEVLISKHRRTARKRTCGDLAARLAYGWKSNNRGFPPKWMVYIENHGKPLFFNGMILGEVSPLFLVQHPYLRFTTLIKLHQIVCFGAGATHFFAEVCALSSLNYKCVQVKLILIQKKHLRKVSHLLRQNWTFQWIVGCT